MARNESPRRGVDLDIVDESSEESFPASDAPGFTPVSGAQAGRTRTSTRTPAGTPARRPATNNRQAPRKPKTRRRG